MTRLLKKLFRCAETAARPAPASATKSSPFKPALESLETRETPALVGTSAFTFTILDTTSTAWSGYIRR